MTKVKTAFGLKNAVCNLGINPCLLSGLGVQLHAVVSCHFSTSPVPSVAKMRSKISIERLLCTSINP